MIEMALQQLEVLPKELLVQFEGVSSLVRPKVEYLGKQAREMPILAGQDGFHQLYTDNIVPVYQQLRAGEQDGYSSLSEKQPLVQAGKLPKDVMVNILSGFGNEVLHRYLIWAELGPDWQPEKRTKGYKLPKGANAVLYRNWDLSGDGINVSNAGTIPVKWLEKSGNVSKEMIQQLGLPEDTYVWTNRKYAIDNFDGLNALHWGFGIRGRPILISYGVPRYWDSYWGALLGRRLSADEMVKNFDPTKVKIEAKPKISQYQLTLQKLEEDLDSSKKLYSELGEKITSMEERITVLKKMKAE